MAPGRKLAKVARSLEQYALRPADGAITLDTLPIVEDESVPSSAAGGAGGGAGGAAGTAEALYAVPELADLGPLVRAGRPTPLTESETEYVVSAAKHVFGSHLVLQYNVTNTLNDQLLVDVSVAPDVGGGEGIWEVEATVPLARLPYGSTPGVTYVVLRYVGGGGAEYPPLTLSNELKFHVHEVDPDTGEAEEDGFEEEYPLEDLEVSPADFMTRVQVPDFRAAWEEMGDEHEAMEKFSLQFKSIELAVPAVIDCLGMVPCENSATPASRTKPHNLYLSGTFVGGVKCLARCQVSLAAAGDASILKIGIRSDNAEISQMLTECIR